MKTLMKLLMVTMAFGLVTGCATNSDIENLQSQVNGLDSSVKQASADAAHAQSSANDASARASAAETAANRAAQLSEDTNSKLSKKFRRSMMK